MPQRSSIPPKVIRTLEELFEGMADGRIPSDLQIAGKKPCGGGAGTQGWAQGRSRARGQPDTSTAIEDRAQSRSGSVEIAGCI